MYPDTKSIVILLYARIGTTKGINYASEYKIDCYCIRRWDRNNWSISYASGCKIDCYCIRRSKGNSMSINYASAYKMYYYCDSDRNNMTINYARRIQNQLFLY